MEKIILVTKKRIIKNNAVTRELHVTQEDL